MRACVAALLLCSCTGAVRVSGTSGGWRSRLRKAASTAGAAFALATAAPSTAALAAPRGASVEPLPELSLGKLLAKDVRRFSSDSFVFSDTIVSADELEEELLDVDAEKGVNPKKVAIKSAFAVGGTVRDTQRDGRLGAGAAVGWRTCGVSAGSRVCGMPSRRRAVAVRWRVQGAPSSQVSARALPA
eukprot:scaffold213562_cov24-Tisochrysis_lutea.AAC.1